MSQILSTHQTPIMYKISDSLAKGLMALSRGFSHWTERQKLISELLELDSRQRADMGLSLETIDDIVNAKGNAKSKSK